MEWLSELGGIVWAAAKPHVTEVVGFLAAGAVVWLRLYVQHRLAVAGATRQEVEHLGRMARGEPVHEGVTKKAMVVADMMSLPRGILRPFSHAAAQDVVERAVPKARIRAKRLSLAPPAPKE